MLHRDPRFIFFALGALLALLISAPNTYQIAAPLHGGGDGWYGIVLTVALVVLLEAGAVGAEIAGVRWLCWSLLGLTFVANCAIGSAAFDKAPLDNLPSLLAWRSSGWGWLLVLFYSASVPVLLYTFLHYALKRMEALSAPQGQAERTPAQEVATVVEPLVTLVATLADRLAPQVAALPDQVAYPRPSLVAPVASEMPQKADPWACGECGTTATPGQRGAAGKHGYWVCKGCGARQDRQN